MYVDGVEQNQAELILHDSMQRQTQGPHCKVDETHLSFSILKDKNKLKALPNSFTIAN